MHKFFSRDFENDKYDNYVSFVSFNEVDHSIWREQTGSLVSACGPTLISTKLFLVASKI